MVKYSGVPIHIWDYNEEIQAKIERLGDPLSRLPKMENISDFDFKIIDIEQIVRKSKTQKDLIYALSTFKHQVEITFEEALKYQSTKMDLEKAQEENNKLKNKLELREKQLQNLKEKNYNLTEENNKLKIAIEGFENQLLNYGLDSTSILTRKKKNIEKNVVVYDFKRDE